MSTPSQPLRIGLIGAGANTRLQHIPGFQRIEGVRIDVVSNRSEASSQKVAQDYGIPRVAQDWQAVVADPLIDAVCIGTWPYLHCKIALAALAAGKHVLSEARMAMNAEEAEQMLAAAQRNPHLVAQVVPAPFSLEYDATIVRLLNELGTLYEISVRHTHSAAANPLTPISWRQRRDLSGNNTLTVGIFYEMLQRWLGAEVEPSKVQATASIVTPLRPVAEPASDAGTHAAAAGAEGTEGGAAAEAKVADAEGKVAAQMLPVTIPDTLGIVGNYSNGVRFQHHYSSITLGAPCMQIVLNLEGGTLRYDLASQKLTLIKSGTANEVVIEPDAGTGKGWQVEADFVRSIREGTPVTLTSFADGVRYMRFTDRVYASARANGFRHAA